jgi:hypothetical protein
MNAGERNSMSIARPYLMFLGDAAGQLAAKTAQGVKDWRRDWCVGQLRLAGCNADLKLPDRGAGGWGRRENRDRRRRQPRRRHRRELDRNLRARLVVVFFMLSPPLAGASCSWWSLEL